MSEFHDPELERLLGRAGGSFPDVNVAYERMLRGVRHARRRRLVVVSGAASGLLFLGAAFALNSSQQSPNVQPGDRGTFDGSFENSLPASVPDSVPDISSAPTSNTADPEVTANSSGSGSSPTTPNTSTGSNPASTTTTTAPAPPVTEVFTGTGGSVTVRLQSGTLTLVSYNASEGFVADLKHTGGDRVEVRFESVDHRTDIRIDLELGSMVPSIEENDT